MAGVGCHEKGATQKTRRGIYRVLPEKAQPVIQNFMAALSVFAVLGPSFDADFSVDTEFEALQTSP